MSICNVYARNHKLQLFSATVLLSAIMFNRVLKTWPMGEKSISTYQLSTLSSSGCPEKCPRNPRTFIHVVV